MDPEMIAMIKEEQELRETDELVQIYQLHDTEAWTDEAFEAIRQILQERLGEVPPQDNRPAAIELVKQAVEALEDDQPSLALDLASQAVSAAPRYAEALKVKGDALTDLRQYDEAIAAYHEALRLDPQRTDIEEFIDVARELRYKYPPQPKGHVEADRLLGQLQPLVDAGHLEEALSICDEAVQAAPTYAKAHHARGMILDELGRLREAIDAYRHALRLDPDLEEAAIDIKYASQELWENGEENQVGEEQKDEGEEP